MGLWGSSNILSLPVAAIGFHHDCRFVCFCLFFNQFIYLFIFGCVGSSLLRVGFLQLWRAAVTPRCSAWASHCGGFSCCRAWALGTQASVVVAHGLSSCGSQALEHRLSSCGAQAQLLRGMWDPPRPELEPVSPALARGFPATTPPGKPSLFVFKATLELGRG